MHRDSTVIAKPALFGDFRLLFALFIALRLTLAVVYQPYLLERYDADGAPAPVERGLSAFGDYQHYLQFAKLSDEGLLPYRDYWYEFPPVWSALFIGAYRLLAARGAVDYTSWVTLLGLLLLVADVGNLMLVRRLGRLLHGEETAQALAWIYALLAAPLIFAWWTFETLVALAILAALVGLVEGRLDRSAGAVVVGALTKYTPLLVLPAVWRFCAWRKALRYTAISLGLVGLMLGMLVVWGGELGVASLTAQYQKASYQSVWALIDGNWRTGSFAGLDAHFDPEAAAAPLGNPSVFPGWARLVVFGGLGLWIYARLRRRDAQGMVAFVTVTFVLFFLWAQGWSPQWTVTLAPLILLNFPTREGVLACVLLCALAFVEYPVLFMRTGATGGEISGALVLPYAAVIVARTGLLAALAVALYRELRKTGGDAEI